MMTLDTLNLHEFISLAHVQVLVSPCHYQRDETHIMVTDEKYTRPPEISAELATLPAPTASNYLDRLQSASIEVVVIIRRQAADQRLRDQIDEILVNRSTRLIRAAVRRHGGVPTAEIDDAEQETMLLFWAAIQSESFFEVRFNLAMQYLAIQAGRNIRGGKQREVERNARRVDSQDSEEMDDRDAPIDIPDDADEYSRLDDQNLVDIGLASLPEEQAKALSLHYRMGLQIYSQDPAERTVATVLGCGERKARKLIADGRTALRRSIGQEDDNE